MIPPNGITGKETIKMSEDFLEEDYEAVGFPSYSADCNICRISVQGLFLYMSASRLLNNRAC